jgi:NAD(P)-dependent dehydrogenase (short-subunit alcohol dehydrogenase family)
MGYNYKSAHSLSGKKVLVTGAGGNLGAEMCRGLTAMGASVVATDISAEKGQALADELAKAGGDAHFIAHDVTDESQWEAAISFAIEKMGGLNGLVNNAAIVPMQYLADLDVEQFKQVQNVNVAGSMLGCKHGLRAMRPEGPAGQGGSIINMSSVMGLAGTIAFGLL